MDKRKDGQTDDPITGCPRRTFQAVDIKRISHGQTVGIQSTQTPMLGQIPEALVPQSPVQTADCRRAGLQEAPAECQTAALARTGCWQSGHVDPVGLSCLKYM